MNSRKRAMKMREVIYDVFCTYDCDMDAEIDRRVRPLIEEAIEAKDAAALTNVIQNLVFQLEWTE